MSRVSGKRGLVTVLLLLVALLVVADLLRPRSFLRGEWSQVTRPEGTPAERLLRRFGIR